MINLQKILSNAIPYVLAIILLFVLRYIDNQKKDAENVNIETMEKLHEAELSNMRLEHQLEIKNIQIHYEKIKTDIDKASPVILDSLFNAYGI